MCKLSTPLYAQRDPRWRNLQLGDQSFGEYGCLVTSFAMFMGFTPDVMLAKISAHGYLGYPGCRACMNTFDLSAIDPKGKPKHISTRHQNSPFPAPETARLVSHLKDGGVSLLEVDMLSNPGHQMHFVLAVGAVGPDRIIVNCPWFDVQDMLCPRFGADNKIALVRAVLY